MTNEEAIKAIKANYPSGGYEDLRKALDMGIEALKHTPCYLDSPCEYQNPDIKMPHTDCIVWHPYPEEKPKNESKKYIVTTSCGEVENRWWLNTFWAITVSKVIAWAELPKPYEGGAEEW